MSPPTFPVIVHSCPAYVDIDNKICRNTLLQQNEIKKESVDRIRWLGQPEEEYKSHGSLIIHFTNKLLAQQILQGGLIFDGNFMRKMAYTPGLPQCFNFLKKCHQTFQSKEDHTCCKFCGTHLLQHCKDLSYTSSIKRCIQCVNKDKSQNQTVNLYDEKYQHSALSQKEILYQTPPPRIHGK
ncbi:hypothetical protein O181_044305 [Austropuccinia psidii MF-1]|uniref:Uncharacterized protein n=1 Tax=Austropuccinia psidii MF-1 TaxID=1389203 RepID=A0A9Q3DP78_9BASI|nr:hypothetical protein [Austropuccinia psidii MF-1]